MNKTAAAVALLVSLLACALPGPDITAPQPVFDVNRPDLWMLTFGDVKSDQAWGVDVDPEGNVYAAAFLQEPGELFSDASVRRYTPEGGLVWSTDWGGDLHEKLFVVTASGPFVFAGGLTHTAADLEEADMLVLALDKQTGGLLWSFTWGQGYGYEEVDGLQTDGEYLYVSGWTTSRDSSMDIAIHKLTLDGELVWTTIWGSGGYDTADGQLVLDDDSIYVSGRYNGANFMAGGQSLIARFDKTSGAYRDHRVWGSNVFSDGMGMAGDGQTLYVVGLTIEAGNGQIFLTRIDRNLDIIWTALWGGEKGESARAVTCTPEGSILVTGSTFSQGSGKSDIILLNFNPDGMLIWEQIWGGDDQEAAHGIVVSGDHAYIAGETASYSAGSYDALLLKVDRSTGQFPEP